MGVGLRARVRAYVCVIVCVIVCVCECVCIHVCACLQLNLDGLLQRMWEEMGLVRVYTKPQGQQPDFSDPVVLSTVSKLLPAPSPALSSPHLFPPSHFPPSSLSLFGGSLHALLCSPSLSGGERAPQWSLAMAHGLTGRLFTCTMHL